ncbi:hypothetical protein Rsub_10641 [Raphidocelis subcapitata]|uniref:Uncharacterized protein n=1 Tax=Raphidocelis subcapitata TaxID=307507 RepID=A0A2V0PDP3_9CHLO|nr:hypothetical protein Rsub_10641 [Raphidocelis subcapitata]|eukprot:GBF97968.1 hypothetical protein Rsub_10641 [Raphidocelis subcapitata]
MHSYTPQQTSGGPRYGAGVIVGNWAEDDVQRAASLRALTAAAGAGALTSTRFRDRVALAGAPAKLSRAAGDGFVHFGDLLQLLHAPTSRALAVDTSPDGAAAARGCGAAGDDGGALRAVATAPGGAAAPAARSTLLLHRYTPLRPSPLEPAGGADAAGPALLYGQKLLLLSNPEARGEPLDARGGGAPLYLAARAAGAPVAGCLGRRRPVHFAPDPSYDAVWAAHAPDPALRPQSLGRPVPAGAPLLLVHCASNAGLCLGGGGVPTDFGLEAEVCAHAAASNGLQLGLEAAARGDDLRSLPPRPLDSNLWTFANGGPVEQLPPGDGPLLDTGALLGAIARAVTAVRPDGAAVLDAKLLRLGDRRGDVEAGDLQLALRQCGAGGEADEEAVCHLLAEYAGAAPGRVAGRVLAAAIRQHAAAEAVGSPKGAVAARA